MLDVSYASSLSDNVRNQINNLNTARSELVAYKNVIETEYHAGEVPALVTKINQVISQIDDAKNRIYRLSDSIKSTAKQIRQEQEEEAARQEAARREAARQEAARQEAARQEAARQEAARQEAARQAAAKQQSSYQSSSGQNSSYSSSGNSGLSYAERQSITKQCDDIRKKIASLKKERSNLFNVFKFGSIDKEIKSLESKLDKLNKKLK